MSYINQQKYYTNDGVNPTDANWGSYQYVSLNDIITNFLLMYDGNHSLINNENRYKILFHAKRAIQELNYDAFKEIKSLELKVYDDLRFVLPSDYVNWVKLYMFHGNTLRELTENIQVQSAVAYIQSATATFTYDGSNNATVVQSDLDTTRKSGALNSIYLNQNNALDDNGNCVDCDGDVYNSRIGARYGLNTETANINPTFTIDKKAGVINFDSTMANRDCVLQYISDGMENGNNLEIQVNKLFEDYVYAYIQYAILRNAKIRLSNIHPSRLLMNMRGEDKWIK